MAMREIKFRIWDKEDNKMCGGYDITDAIFNHKENRGSPNGCAVIMQYTGLKDKNGKEIYEGDIIDYGNERYYPITYKVNGFGIEFSDTHHERMWLDLSKFEVIGNIYETPILGHYK